MINEPAQYDINVYQDRDFFNTFIIKDQAEALIDISDWNLSAQIRPTYNSDILIADFTVTKDESISSITIQLSDTTTRAIEAENPISSNSTTTSTNMVWDLVVEEGTSGDRFSLISGICNFYDTVTRST